MAQYYYVADKWESIERDYKPNNGWTVLAFVSLNARLEYLHKHENAEHISKSLAETIIGEYEMIYLEDKENQYGGAFIVTPGKAK